MIGLNLARADLTRDFGVEGFPGYRLELPLEMEVAAGENEVRVFALSISRHVATELAVTRDH